MHVEYSLYHLTCRSQTKQNESTEDEAIRITYQLSSLCRRSAGVLDWLPLVESVLTLQSNNDIEKS